MKHGQIMSPIFLKPALVGVLFVIGIVCGGVLNAAHAHQPASPASLPEDVQRVLQLKIMRNLIAEVIEPSVLVEPVGTYFDRMRSNLFAGTTYESWYPSSAERKRLAPRLFKRLAQARKINSAWRAMLTDDTILGMIAAVQFPLELCFFIQAGAPASVLQALIARGADVNARGLYYNAHHNEYNGMHPVSLALKMGRRDIVAFLVVQGAVLQDSDVMDVVKNDDVATVALSLDHGALINARYDSTKETLLEIVLRSGTIGMVQFLMSRGAVIPDGDDIMYRAIGKDKKAKIAFLLGHGRSMPRALLGYAAASLAPDGDDGLLEFLVSNGAVLDYADAKHTSLTEAIRHHNVHGVRELLRLGAEPRMAIECILNNGSVFHGTPLDYARITLDYAQQALRRSTLSDAANAPYIAAIADVQECVRLIQEKIESATASATSHVPDSAAATASASGAGAS